MKKKCLIIYLLFLSLFANAQLTDNIIPPSPEVAALAKYADAPVNAYSGIPQIDVPLYNLKCGSLELPVSLSYYAGGIAVEDVPTWVGLGWTLNAGGVITRTIRGKAENVLANGTVSPIVEGLPLTYTNPGDDVFAKVQNCALEANETEPDAFYYNFNGRSGTFYFNNQGLPVCKKYEDIKIEYLYVAASVSKFIVTLEDGSKYFFEETDQLSPPVDISTWYLTKIVDANGISTINFQYDVEQYFVDHPSRPDKYYYFNQFNTGGIYLGQYTDLKCDKRGYTNRRLRLITTSNNDSIQFIAKTAIRQDVETSNARALEEILVKNNAGKTVKRYKLITNNIRTTKPYTTAMVGFMCPDVSDDYVNNRLYLDEVRELSESGGSNPFYKFQYYGRTPDGKDSLSSRVSFAQDWGGYYNGHDENTELVPAFNDYLYPDIPSIGNECVRTDYPRNIVSIPGANRSMNLRYKKMGSLSSMIYAPGGNMQLEYGSAEPGYQNYTYGGLRIEKLTYFDGSGKQVKSKRYEYSLPCIGYALSFSNYTYYDNRAGSLTPFPLCDQVNLTEYNVAMRISSGPLNDLGVYEGPIIGYQSVKEIEDGNGYTVYSYTGNCAAEGESINLEVIADLGMNYKPYFTMSVQGFYWPFNIRSDLSWKRGILLNKAVFDESGQRLSETDYSYTFQELGSIPAIKAYTAKPNGIYVYRQFNYPVSWNRLDATTEIQYDGTTPSQVTKEYQYASAKHKQVTKEIVTGSNNVKHISRYKYPPDYTVTVASPVKLLQDKHMISPKIEEMELVNETGVENQVGGTVTLFGSSGSTVRPVQILKAETTVPFAPQESGFNNTTGQVTYHANYKPFTYLDAYDEKNNIQQFHQVNDHNIAILWGYNKTLPVAKVTNAAASQVFYTSFEDDGVALTDAAGENLARSGVKVWNSNTYTIPASFNPPAGPTYKMSYWYYNGTAWVFSGELDFVRTIPASGTKLDEVRVYPAGSLMTTYTYAPLIGMTSECGPDNTVTYYEFDDFGRLKTVRNSDREIIKTYTYNYKQ